MCSWQSLFLSRALFSSCASSGGTIESSERVLSLSSLNRDCKLIEAWVGVIPILEDGLWLSCGEGRPSLVVHPLNLYKKIELENEIQAMEMASFVTDYKTGSYFVELESIQPNWPLMQNLAEVSAGARKLLEARREPEIRTARPQVGCDGENSDNICRKTMFYIDGLLLVQPDGLVYRSKVTLTEDGWFSVEYGELILGDYFAIAAGYG